MYTVTRDMKTWYHATDLEESLDIVTESIPGNEPIYVTWCDKNHEEGEVCKSIASM